MKERCNVCKENDSKYRCPSCRMCYCSLQCSKIHKTECYPPIISADESKDNKETNNDGDEFILLSTEQKSDLINSNEIQDALKSTRLKNDLIAIDSAKNRQSVLKRARNKPEFEEFISKILKVVNTSPSQIKGKQKRE